MSIKIHHSKNANMIVCRNYSQMLDLEDLIQTGKYLEGKTPDRWDAETESLYRHAQKLDDLHVRYWEKPRHPRVYIQSDDPRDEELYLKTNLVDIANDLVG